MIRQIEKFPFLKILIPAILFALVLNPYMTPDLYDNLIYYIGAQNIPEYSIDLSKGLYLIGWPPVFAFLLAIPHQLGHLSPIVGKGIVMGLALFSISLFYRLFRLEKRFFPIISCFLVAISPTGVIIASKMLTEWPFTFFAVAFLLLLHHLNVSKHKWITAFAATFCLILAIMTRYIGVALLLPVAMSAIKNLKEKRSIFALKYEFFIGVIASGAYLCWKYYVASEISAICSTDEVPCITFLVGLERFQYFSLTQLLYQICDLFFHIHLIIPTSEDLSTKIFLYSIGGLITIGFLSRPKKISDAFVVGILVILSCYFYKITRYLLPVAPFLLSDLLLGCSICLNLLNGNRQILKIGTTLWAIIFILLNSAYLLVGNMESYNGASFLVSSTPEKYYEGEWKDLYLANQFIKQHPLDEKLGIDSDHFQYDAYIWFFSEQPITRKPEKTGQFFISTHQTLSSFQDEVEKGNFSHVETFGNFRVFQREGVKFE